jgi:ABC-type antimicrobial peptide transport system permease subunit
MALILGVVGIYGTISFSMAQRTREVGIRLALGSPARDITAMFVRQGLARERERDWSADWPRPSRSRG